MLTKIFVYELLLLIATSKKCIISLFYNKQSGQPFFTDIKQVLICKLIVL